MTSLYKLKQVALVNLRYYAIKAAMKGRLGVEEIKLRHSQRGALNGRQFSPQLFRQRKEYARNLSLFRLAQRLQFVVGLNRLKRLYEGGRAGGRKSVSHTFHAPAMVGFDRNHEAVVPQGHKLILNRGLGASHQ